MREKNVETPHEAGIEADNTQSKGSAGQTRTRRFFRWLFSKEGVRTTGSLISGAVVTVLVTQALQAIGIGSKSIDDLQTELTVQTGELQTQTDALEKGFETLASAMRDGSGNDPQTMQILENLSQTVQNLSLVSDSVSQHAIKAADLADYYKAASQLPHGVKEVWVSGKDLNAVRLDRKNDIAVLYDDSDKGMSIKVNFNGSSGWWQKGGRKKYVAANGQESALTYMGKSGDHYLFHRLTL